MPVIHKKPTPRPAAIPRSKKALTVNVDLRGVVTDNATSDKRMAEAILYIASKCKGDSLFGATKLNKTLFFADFFSFIRYGKPVTGAEYMKLENGPVPRRLLPVNNALVKNKRAKLLVRPLGYGRVQKRLVPLSDPNLDDFSGQETAILDEVIEWLKHASAQDVSSISHDRAWRLAKDRETIPYETAFVYDASPRPEVLKAARKVASEHGWNAS